MTKQVTEWAVKNAHWLPAAKRILLDRGVKVSEESDLMVALLEEGLCHLLQTDPEHLAKGV